MTIPGYTLSLTLWIVPVVAFAVALGRAGKLNGTVGRALALSAGIIALLGSLLDLLFANLFFLFPNPEAVIGWRIRGIPVEEFGFYLFGGWFLVLGYAWCDEMFLARYNRPDGHYRRWSRRTPTWILPTPAGWVAMAAAALAAILVKRFLNPGGMAIPGYFLFLLVAAYVPSILFYRRVRRFVNWQGFVLTLVATLFISILWEVTLALPLGWWNYRHGAMLGIFVQPWSALPFEAVTVWVFSSFAILLYEAAKILLHGRSPGKD